MPRCMQQRAPQSIDPPELAAAAGTPLYVHLPFCAAKCHYCDFFSVPVEGHDVDGMLSAIVREAELRAPRDPRTVYFGGGTPSLLDAPQLKRLLDELDRITGWRASAVEVTAECNPESLDLDKAKRLLDLGVRRVSIGFQSLHDQVLELFGRVHSVADSFRAFDAARSAGFAQVNVDLIYAVPGQTTAQWLIDLERIVALAPQHVSAYNLTFEEETPFRRWLEQGRLAKQPEEVELELFAATRERLARAGLSAYEVSNFSVTASECRHNIQYWHNGEYVGIGPSAVSKIGVTRLGNVKTILGYRRQIESSGRACAWFESPSALARLGETWWLGLRLRDGLSAADARRRSAIDEDEFGEAGDPALPIAERLLELGMLEIDGEIYRLSARGLPVADAVAREFLELGLERARASARAE
jgi:oxygen-independent coproporphyrinogen-3 oxidase